MGPSALALVLACAALAAGLWLLLSLLLGDEARERRIGALVARAGQGAPATLPARAERWLLRAGLATHPWRARLGLLPDREKLVRAGLRLERGDSIFFAYQCGSLALMCLAWVVLLASPALPHPGPATAIALIFFSLYAALRLPKMLLDRRGQARQRAIRRAWPEVLDLMVIQIEAGRSPEQALRRAREEMAPRCRPLADELALTLAELDIVDRRQAYDNFAARTDIDDIRSACAALMQAYEQGTSLGETFRTLARESRNTRFLAAEKKSAQLVSALPLPVAFFFLLPLMLLLAGPTLIRYMKWG
ncbi:MAG: type II secretion system F family protein [Pseudomonadota bacterium]